MASKPHPDDSADHPTGTVTDDAAHAGDPTDVPRPLRLAAVIARVQAAGLVIAAAVLLVLIVVHSSTRLWAAFAVVGFALLGAAVLWFGARGLLHLRPSSRTPILMLQLLTLPVTYSLGIQAGWYWIGIPIMALAVAEIGLLLARPSRIALDRTF